MHIVGGLDEVGYGALAGPFVSVVAVFREKDYTFLPSGVTDSKKTSEAQRGSMYDSLCAAAYDVGIGHAWPYEIDTLGVATALQLSYTRALDEIHPTRRPTLLWVDGNHLVKSWSGAQFAEPKADLNHIECSAASIIAKVFRDRLMEQESRRLKKLGQPDYAWEKNKGYGSHQHEEAIRQHGLLLNAEGGLYIHRKLYCRKFLVTEGKTHGDVSHPLPVL